MRLTKDLQRHQLMLILQYQSKKNFSNRELLTESVRELKRTNITDIGIPPLLDFRPAIL